MGVIEKGAGCSRHAVPGRGELAHGDRGERAGVPVLATRERETRGALDMWRHSGPRPGRARGWRHARQYYSASNLKKRREYIISKINDPTTPKPSPSFYILPKHKPPIL